MPTTAPRNHSTAKLELEDEFLIERGIFVDLTPERTPRHRAVRVNAGTVYAACLGLSVISLHETWAAALVYAGDLKPIRIGDELLSGNVVTIEPGMLNDDLCQGRDGTNDAIQLDRHNQFERPEWMLMEWSEILDYYNT